MTYLGFTHACKGDSPQPLAFDVLHRLGGVRGHPSIFAKDSLDTALEGEQNPEEVLVRPIPLEERRVFHTDPMKLVKRRGSRHGRLVGSRISHAKGILSGDLNLALVRHRGLKV